MGSDYLMHYGVHGMKWGIKKFRRKNPKSGPLYNVNSSLPNEPSYGRKKNYITPEGVGYHRDPNETSKKEDLGNTDNVKYLSQIGEQIFKRLFEKPKKNSK